jgi:hypothetical protein
METYCLTESSPSAQTAKHSAGCRRRRSRLLPSRRLSGVVGINPNLTEIKAQEYVTFLPKSTDSNWYIRFSSQDRLWLHFLEQEVTNVLQESS